MSEKEKFIELISYIMFVGEEYSNESFAGNFDEDKFDELGKKYFPDEFCDEEVENYCVDKIKTLSIALGLWKDSKVE